MRVLTTIPDVIEKRSHVELLECCVDLPDGYGVVDWYEVQYLSGGGRTMIPGDVLGPITIANDENIEN